MYVFCQRALAPLSLTATSSTRSSFAILLSLKVRSKSMACLPSFLLRNPPGCRRHQVKVSHSPSRSFHSLLSFRMFSQGIISYRIVVCVCVCGRRCRKLYSGSWWVLPFFDLTEAVESTQSEAEWITVQAGLVDAYTTSGATATPVLW